ncbi:GAP family protein [Cellulomonas sp. McL0617]|uniref:GAP family protein n=1 Tax=Cellulomonas sp. McL0617 TaxID=3415675 RepID=UPI003CF74FB0
MISPLPIVAVVLMLSSAKAKVNAFSFLIAWFVAVAGVAGVIALLAGTDDASDLAGPAAWTGWLKIVLGLLLVWLAIKDWRGRPRAGVEAPTPKWMQAIDTFTPVKAAGLAVLLGAVNPKNLLLVVSGGATIAAAAPDDTTAQIGAAIVFGLVACIGVAAPIVIYLSMGSRAAGILDELKGWLIQHNTIVMAVLLLIIGAKLVGAGITVLS